MPPAIALATSARASGISAPPPPPQATGSSSETVAKIERSGGMVRRC